MQPTHLDKMSIQINCGVYDCISAKFASKFSDYLFLSGLSLAAAGYYEIDCGLHSFERIERVSTQLGYLNNIKPIIADIDDSFGDYTLAGKYCKKLAKANVYGIVMEDQSRPRKCGHKSGKGLNPKSKYIQGLQRIKDEAPNMFVVARTDAETNEDLEERIEMLQEAAQAGLANAIQMMGSFERRNLSVKAKFDKSILVVANHVDGGKLMINSFEELQKAGVNILTLSTYLISHYMNCMEK